MLSPHCSAQPQLSQAHVTIPSRPQQARSAQVCESFRGFSKRVFRNACFSERDAEVYACHLFCLPLGTIFASRQVNPPAGFCQVFPAPGGRGGRDADSRWFAHAFQFRSGCVSGQLYIRATPWPGMSHRFCQCELRTPPVCQRWCGASAT